MRHQLHGMTRELKQALNDLRHAVRDDLHGLAKNGNGQQVAAMQHDLKLIKREIDLVIHDESRAIRVAVKRGRHSDAADVTPAATVTGVASPTAETSPTGVPTPTMDASTLRTRPEERRDEDGPGRGRGHSPAPALVAPRAPASGIIDTEVNSWT